MAMVDGGDLVVRAIKQEGVDTIFTLCGGHVQAIYDAPENQRQGAAIYFGGQVLT